MTLEVISPATIFDLAALAGARSRLHWAVAREMHGGGLTWALREDGETIGLFGLYPTDGGAEAWFNVAPAAARHMGFIIRRTRLTLAHAPYPAIVVLCTSAAGVRIARACGFQFVKRTDGADIYGKSLRGQR